MKTLPATSLAVALSIAALAQPAPSQNVTNESGVVEEVTLYRGQALVIRRVPLPTRQGPLEVVVTDIPAGVLTGSLYAEAGDGVEVRAVRYRQRAVGEAPRAEIRTLDATIAEAQTAIAANQANQNVVQARIQYLDRLESFVAPTAHADLAKGALDAEALERLVQFGFTERQKASDQMMALQAEARELQQGLTLLQKQRAELTTGTSTVLREAVVFLEKRRAGAASVRLGYLVAGCGWSPAYNLRADRAAGKVRVEYDAHIQQRTGEDWSAVKLTLSTASPALSAEGPGLAPFAVTLTGQAPANFVGEDGSRAYQAIAELQKKAQFRNQREVSARGNFDSAMDVNFAANQAQCFELQAGAELLTALRRESAEVDNGPSLSYEIEGTVSLASRPDQQMVRILRAELPARLRYVATPVLAPHVYREAAFTNTSGHDFLAGPVSAYLDGRFVGRAEIGNVSQGQALVVGLGADPGLLARRVIRTKKERVQGGNRIVDLEVRLKIENFRGEPVAVRLFDRLPYSADNNALRVTLGAMTDELSTDATYVENERPRGILRWDVEIVAGAAAEKAHQVDYAYTMELERNLHISSQAAQADAYKEQFQQLQRARGRR